MRAARCLDDRLPQQLPRRNAGASGDVRGYDRHPQRDQGPDGRRSRRRRAEWRRPSAPPARRTPRGLATGCRWPAVRYRRRRSPTRHLGTSLVVGGCRRKAYLPICSVKVDQGPMNDRVSRKYRERAETILDTDVQSVVHLAGNTHGSSPLLRRTRFSMRCTPTTPTGSSPSRNGTLSRDAKDRSPFQPSSYLETGTPGCGQIRGGTQASGKRRIRLLHQRLR